MSLTGDSQNFIQQLEAALTELHTEAVQEFGKHQHKLVVSAAALLLKERGKAAITSHNMRTVCRRLEAIEKREALKMEHDIDLLEGI